MAELINSGWLVVGAADEVVVLSQSLAVGHNRWKTAGKPLEVLRHSW